MVVYLLYHPKAYCHKASLWAKYAHRWELQQGCVALHDLLDLNHMQVDACWPLQEITELSVACHQTLSLCLIASRCETFSSHTWSDIDVNWCFREKHVHAGLQEDSERIQRQSSDSGGANLLKLLHSKDTSVRDTDDKGMIGESSESKDKRTYRSQRGKVPAVSSANTERSIYKKSEPLSSGEAKRMTLFKRESQDEKISASAPRTVQDSKVPLLCLIKVPLLCLISLLSSDSFVHIFFSWFPSPDLTTLPQLITQAYFSLVSHSNFSNTMINFALQGIEGIPDPPLHNLQYCTK